MATLIQELFTPGPDTFIHVAEVAGLGLLGWISLKIKAAVSEVSLEQSRVKEELIKGQAKMKEELLHEQNELREDMDAKHAENSKAIAAHSASDAALFEGISRTLTRIDSKGSEDSKRMDELSRTLGRIDGKIDLMNHK